MTDLSSLATVDLQIATIQTSKTKNQLTNLRREHEDLEISSFDSRNDIEGYAQVPSTNQSYDEVELMPIQMNTSVAQSATSSDDDLDIFTA